MRALYFILPLLLAETASACLTHRGMTNQDVVAAEIIFEGELLEYETEQYFSSHSKGSYLEGRSPELVFKVNKVLRGEINEDTIRVGWAHGTFGHPAWQDEFEKVFGKTMRVALTTPKQVKNLCYIDSYYGMGEKRRASYDCDLSLAGFYPNTRADEIPFILNGPCSGPYMFNLKRARPGIYFPKIYRNRLAILSDRAEVPLRFAQAYPEKITKDFLNNPDNEDEIFELALRLIDELEAQSRKTNDKFVERSEADIEEFYHRFKDSFIPRLKQYVPLFEKDPDYKARVINYRNGSEIDSE